MNARRILILASVGVLFQASATEDAPALENNPFSRPLQTVVSSGGSPRGAGPVGDKEFVLRATMVSGGQSLANVGGRIVRPGQVVLGHRLITVHEDRAVFEANEKYVTLLVKPEREEEDGQ